LKRAVWEVLQLLSSGVSQRRIALLLHLHRTTVARKLAYLARVSEDRQNRRTWCTTKKKEGLEQHLAVYRDFHNRILLGGA
jgi:hypothetical protein